MDLPFDMRLHGFGFSLLFAIMMLMGLGGGARADWPTDPSSPLVVGQAEGIIGGRLSIVEGSNDGVWVAWQDSFCEGFVRLQNIRFHGTLLSPNGLAVQEDPTCGNTTPPMLLSNGDGVVVSRALSSIGEYPVQRIGNDGSLLWADGFSVTKPIGLGLREATELPGGDVLIVSSGFATVHVDRVDASGNRVWAEQTVFSTTSGANFRVFGVVPDSTGGVYIFYDSFLSYTKLIFVMRIQGDGTPAWAAPIWIMLPPPGISSSRHSDPVAVSDGVGGAVVVWVHGHETGTAPIPLRVQRVGTDGSLAFDIDGLRVSLGVLRQFDPKVRVDQASGDLLIVWRDGQFEEMTIRAQRYTVDGDRLWGDFGVAVAPTDSIVGSFDSVWHNNQLSVVVGDSTGVEMFNFDALGQPALGPWTIAENQMARDVRAEKSGDGIVVVWQGDAPGFDDFVAAQRVNPDGQLGGAGCSVADLNQDGSLDFFDVSILLTAFSVGDLIADFNGDGSLDFFDISVFLTAFGAGCP